MASLNRVMLIGNLGKDPELKFTPSGKAVAKFPLATSERWRDSSGNQQEKTEWHNIVVWDKQAEIARDYLKKGRQVYIEGRIQTRQYDDKDGQKKWFTEIVAQRFLMLGRKDDQSGGSGDDSGSYGQPQPQPQTQGSGSMSGDDDDLPF